MFGPPPDAAAYGRSFANMSGYARRVYEHEEMKNAVTESGGKVLGAGAAVGAMYGLGGVKMVAGGLGVYGAHKGLKYLQGKGLAKWYTPGKWAGKAAGGAILGPLKLGGKGLFSLARKIPGLAGPAALGAGWIANQALKLGKAAEYGARAALTGGLPRAVGGTGVAAMADAWMPFRHLPMKDMRKFALNPRIASRLGWGAAALAVGGLWKDMAFSGQHAPTPTVTYDGRYVQHIDDMGANADYAQTILGPNSNMSRSLIPLADDALLIAGRAFIR